MVTIKALPNASYKVTGWVTVESASGVKKEISEGQEVFLCRCGQSRNKPYCDGTHKVCGFTDE